MEKKTAENELQPFEHFPELQQSIEHAANNWKVNNGWSQHLSLINSICAELLNLRATQQPVQDDWIRVEDRLPAIKEKEFESDNVIVCWGPNPGNVTSMSYRCVKVRGKLIKRFEWNWRISPFKITHWMPFPTPPNQ